MLLVLASALALGGAFAAGIPNVASAAPAASAPSGYSVALGPIVPVADGTQVRSTAHCPHGTVPLGGGIFVDALGLISGINSSFPITGGWTGTVHNESGDSGSMQVAVTCARKPAHYSVVVSRSVVNPSLHRTTVAAFCPKSAKPLGGGSQSVGTPLSSLAGSRPFRNGWQVTEENGTANITVRTMIRPAVKAFAVCGAVANYRLVAGKPQTVQMLSQTNVTAVCPTGSVVLGGGASIHAEVSGVNFDTTGPIDPTALAVISQAKSRLPFAWQTVVNNDNILDATAAPFAICAGR